MWPCTTQCSPPRRLALHCGVFWATRTFVVTVLQGLLPEYDMGSGFDSGSVQTPE